MTKRRRKASVAGATLGGAIAGAGIGKMTGAGGAFAIARKRSRSNPKPRASKVVREKTLAVTKGRKNAPGLVMVETGKKTVVPGKRRVHGKTLLARARALRMIRKAGGLSRGRSPSSSKAVQNYLRRQVRRLGDVEGTYVQRLLKRSGSLRRLGKKAAIAGAAGGAALGLGAGIAATRRRRG